MRVTVTAAICEAWTSKATDDQFLEGIMHFIKLVTVLLFSVIPMLSSEPATVATSAGNVGIEADFTLYNDDIPCCKML